MLVLFACVAQVFGLHTRTKKNGEQQLTKNVETQRIEKIPDVVREAITDFRMMHMKNLSLGVMRKCRRHFLRKNWEDAQK